MHVRRFLFAIAAIAFFPPLAAHAAVAEICNNGNVELSVARAVYSKSLLFGNSYEITGWYKVEPNKCETVYSSTDAEDLYLGFTYLDPKDVLRSYVSEPSDNSGFARAVSEKFCVNVDKAFDYKISTKGATGCQNGFAPLEFSLFIGADGGDYGRVTYRMSPDRRDPTNPVFGGSAATAKMLVGGAVELVGKTWKLPDGTEYLPPAAPKQQYAVDRAPVAQSIKQITDTLATVQTCSNNELDTNVSKQGFTMDDRGVVVTTNTFTDALHSAGYSNMTAMSIGNMDLPNAKLTDRGGCWELEVLCKGYVGCAQHGEGSGAVGVVAWAAYVNTNQQATILLNALKAMAPYYPDATPEIHQN